MKGWVCAAAVVWGVLAATPVPIVVEQNIEVVSAPSFEVGNVTVFMMMDCSAPNDNACFYGSADEPGPWNRAPFLSALAHAFNNYSRQARLAWDDEPLPSGSWKDAIDTTYFRVDPDPLSSDPAGVSQMVHFDRVEESTKPFTPQVVKSRVDSKAIPSPMWWNVRVRFTMHSIPVDVADSFRSVLTGLPSRYPQATIHWDGVWVSTEYHFITQRIDDPKGRGTKDQQLLIPLLIGVFCMLVCPILVTAAAVGAQKRRNKVKAQLAAKERMLEALSREVAAKGSILEEMAAKEVEMTEMERKAKAAETDRIERELDEDDVDWRETDRLVTY
eukprot:Sspe_Gene.102948::Locus_78800_Transcript_1_1_Confidence_1.000_Length_1208::g.102948::m.102948